MRSLIWVGVATVFASGVMAQVVPTPLTPGQKTAVREALRKLTNYAVENWHDEDSRWEALDAAEETHQESNGSKNCNLPMAEKTHMMTMPRKGKLSSKVASDVYLNASKWKGNKWKGLDDPVACWVLASDLLHEGDHQDDDYPWPVPPAKMEKYYCEERDASAKEVNVLADALDELEEAQTNELNIELEEAKGQHRFWLKLKEEAGNL